MNKIFHFWAKKPFEDPFEDSSVKYVFHNNEYRAGSLDNVISLGFVEKYGGEFGPVASIYFTEEQLVEFIISAEKALQSMRS